MTLKIPEREVGRSASYNSLYFKMIFKILQYFIILIFIISVSCTDHRTQVPERLQILGMELLIPLPLILIVLIVELGLTIQRGLLLLLLLNIRKEIQEGDGVVTSLPFLQMMTIIMTLTNLVMTIIITMTTVKIRVIKLLGLCLI